MSKVLGKVSRVGSIIILVLLAVFFLAMLFSPVLRASDEVTGSLEINESFGNMEVRVTVVNTAEGDGRRFYLEGVRKNVRFKPIYIVKELVPRDFVGEYDLSKYIGWEWSFELFVIEPGGKTLIPLARENGRVGLSSK